MKQAKKKKVPLLKINTKKLVGLLIIGCLFSGFLFLNLLIKDKRVEGLTVPKTAHNEQFPELSTLNGSRYTFQELEKIFQDIATQKGAVYAFEVLKIAQLPPDTDLHLLGHIVGDELYKQQGLDGIKVCTQDFRNACSHSIVINVFLERGLDGLSDIAYACRQAPGGKGAYTMCFHGLGHGVLAYEGYDMEKTIELCKKTGTAEYGYQEADQCIGGAVMEIISGGGHDRDIFERMRPKYLNTQNPFELCTSDTMPESARYLCFSYLTPFLFETVSGSWAHPDAQDHESAFTLCTQLENPSYRNACYGSFGKEFIVLANARDIRNIADSPDEALLKTYEWCLLAKDKDGIRACIGQALQSLYWGGENDPKGALNLCRVISDPFYKESCYGELFGAVSYYRDEREYKEMICSRADKEYRQMCKERLLN